MYQLPSFRTENSQIGFAVAVEIINRTRSIRRSEKIQIQILFKMIDLKYLRRKIIAFMFGNDKIKHSCRNRIKFIISVRITCNDRNIATHGIDQSQTSIRQTDISDRRFNRPA